MSTSVETREKNNLFLSKTTPDVVSNTAQVVCGEDQEDWPSPVVVSTTDTVSKPENETPEPYKSHFPERKRRDPMTIERANLVTVTKLVIKELLDLSLAHGRTIEEDYVPLQQFFVVLEHVLRHGIKPKKVILRERRDFWQLLERVEKFEPEAADITSSVRDMPNLKTPLGRARAWLRLALMQKKLADYFKVLVENRDSLLNEFYECGATMLDEESFVISGLLVGLNVIDCNLSIKDMDLDAPMGVIDFSLYMREFSNKSSEEDQQKGTDKMAAILDQKNYLEELNRHLNATVGNLQSRLESVQTAHTLLREDLAITADQLRDTERENSELKAENELLHAKHSRQMEAQREDLATERETYQTSREGLDQLCQDLTTKLREETQTRLDVERELSLQIGMKQELEMAVRLLEKDVQEKHSTFGDVERELSLQIGMKQELEMAVRLLEKDVHEKQDSMVALRKQLDEVKQINIEVAKQLQEQVSVLGHKSELVTRLEQQSLQMSKTMAHMEASVKASAADKQAAEETARRLGQQLADKDTKRSALETDLRIEREWRGTLQRSLDQEKERVTKLQGELVALRDLKKEHDALRKSYEQIKRTSEEQEATLRDLGSHLSESKLKMEDMKEVQQVFREALWAADKEVLNCRACSKAFSVSRRKHHCRNCGDIFCNECSDNKMPLPSSAKSVRVCDSCHSLLLQRYSAT